MKWQEKSYSMPLPFRYVLSEPSHDRLVVLLHGYQDHAQSMLKRMGWLDAELPFQWLAINAPFPVPVWNAEGFKEAYSWYFRDTSRNLVVVAPQTTASKVAALFEDLNLGQRQKVFFGFSQGGYLAPFVAQQTSAVRGIIGVGCGYTPEGYKDLPATKVFAVHGLNDERIALQQAKEEHQTLMQNGFTGSFHEIPGLTHKLDPMIDALVRDLIHQCFEDKP